MFNDLHNERAMWLLDKKELAEKDKEFLRKHIESYRDLCYSLNAELLFKEDIIDDLRKQLDRMGA